MTIGPTPLLRKPIRPALRDRALEGGPRVHTLQPRGQVRIWPELVEYLGHFADKTHLDVGAGQRRPDKEFASVERAVDIAQMVGDFAVDTRMQRRARLLQPRDIEIEHQRQHRRAFGIMQPLVIGLILYTSPSPRDG